MPSRPKSFRPHAAPARADYRREEDRRRGSRHERGYDRDWEKLREWRLAVSPLCRHCEIDGRVTPATEVDHVKRFRLGDGRIDHRLRLDPKNTQALCDLHHDAKSRRERQGEAEPPRYR